MRQTTFRTDSGSSEERIIVPLGIVRLIRSGFKRYRIDELLDGFKDAGVPMSRTIENLCIAALDESYSMLDWDMLINRSELRKEFYCGECDIRYWTMDRDLERLGAYLEEVVDHLAKVSRVLYPDTPTHVLVDGSHVERNGSKGENVKYGEGGGSVQLQDQFMVATNAATGTPIAAELYPGNQNDPQQYKDFIPQLMYLLNRGSLVIMDNGGSAGEILDEITRWGNAYITRLRLNPTDEAMIRERKDEMVYVGMGVACIRETFESSGRTKYLFFSVDSYAASLARADKALADLEAERTRAKEILTETNDPRNLVRTPKSPFYEVVVDSARIVMTNDPWEEPDLTKEKKEVTPTKGGWFKLECPFQMDSRLVLVIYRHRVDIEHAISTLKSVVNLAPMRVWAKSTTRGKLVLGTIIQFILSAAIYDMKPEIKKRAVDRRTVEVWTKPDPATVVKELRRYQGIVRAYPWGSHWVDEVRDCGVLDAMVAVLDRYDEKGAIMLPESSFKHARMPPQAVRPRKIDKKLAMSILQFFETEVYPHFMKGRSHWKIGDPRELAVYSEPPGLDPESDGAPGLRGKRAYYGENDLFRLYCKMDPPEHLQ